LRNSTSKFTEGISFHGR